MKDTTVKWNTTGLDEHREGLLQCPGSWPLGHSKVVAHVVISMDRIWNLPYNSHRSIVHCTSHIPTVSHLVFNRFCSLMSSVSSSSSALLHSVFIPCTQYIYTFTGYNYTLGHEHCATYSTFDFHAANLIRHIRSSYGLKSPCEGIIFYVSCY